MEPSRGLLLSSRSRLPQGLLRCGRQLPPPRPKRCIPADDFALAWRPWSRRHGAAATRAHRPSGAFSFCGCPGEGFLSHSTPVHRSPHPAMKGYLSYPLPMVIQRGQARAHSGVSWFVCLTSRRGPALNRDFFKSTQIDMNCTSCKCFQ
jgi:hypothetical protein